MATEKLLAQALACTYVPKIMRTFVARDGHGVWYAAGLLTQNGVILALDFEMVFIN